MRADTRVEEKETFVQDLGGYKSDTPHTWCNTVRGDVFRFVQRDKERCNMAEHTPHDKVMCTTLFNLMSTIADSTTLKSKLEMQAATYLAETMGIPLHNDFQKNWDTIKSMYFVLNNSNPESNILDAGGGYHSPVLKKLADLGYKGLYACDIVDVNYEFDYKDKIIFSIQHLECTDYQDNYFDCVLCLSVIEHGLDLHRYFREMSRVTKAGGILILTTDYWPDLVDCSGIFPYGENNPEMKVYQYSDIVKIVDMAAENGFSLCAPLKMDVQEKAVRWNAVDREYTFAFIALRKNT